MFRFSSFIALALLPAMLAGCVTPSATSSRPGVVWVPSPPEVEQYSDFLVGRYAYLANDPALAAATARRAAERAPENGFLLERAVSFLLVAGETEEAVELARKGQKKVRDIGSITRLTLAAEAFRTSRYDEARVLLRQGDMDIFNRMIARSLAAWAAVGEGDAAGAKTHLIEAFVGDNLFDGVNLYMLAFIHETSGNEEEALEIFDAVWSERMRLAIAADQYSRLLAARGDTDKALEIVRQFRLEIGPNPAVDLVREKLEAGEPVEQRTLTPREGASYALFALGAAYVSETEADFASAYFQLALYINPDMDFARTLLGATLSKSERHAEAMDVLMGVKPDSPFYASSRGQIARVLLRMDQPEQAVALAVEAYEQTKDRDLAVQIGELHFGSDEPQSAYDWFNRVVEEDEAEGREDWRSYYARAIALDELDRWEEAEKDLLRAIEIHPNQPEVLNYLGYSWVDRGIKLEEAFQLIQRAVHLSPGSGYIVDSLGWAYYRLGHYQQAVQYLETAVALASGDPTITDHLGDAYWRAGRYLEAGFQWKHALELGPDDENRVLITEKLKHGLEGAAVNPVPFGETDTDGTNTQ